MKRIIFILLILMTISIITGCNQPIEHIILSTNIYEIVEGESFTLTYSILPDNAKVKNIKWDSVDTKIATVNDGTIVAVSPGTTVISASAKNGVIATCSITVKEKSAYFRLLDDERKFVDRFLQIIEQFKNPGSVIIKNIVPLESGKSWWVIISAQNGFGAMSSSLYSLSDYGLENRDKSISVNSFNEQMDKIGIYYDIDLINKAIIEKL